jgi:ribosomal protein L37AE/L43A
MRKPSRSDGGGSLSPWRGHTIGASSRSDEHQPEGAVLDGPPGLRRCPICERTMVLIDREPSLWVCTECEIEIEGDQPLYDGT